MRIATDDVQVVGCKHGRQLIRDWRARQVALLPRLCRRNLGRAILQLARHHDCLFLLMLWSGFRSPPDGIVEVLVWMVGGQTQSVPRVFFPLPAG